MATIIPAAFVIPASFVIPVSFVIAASTNLVEWVPVFTNTTAADGAFDFADTQSANLAQRFYRATAAP